MVTIQPGSASAASGMMQRLQRAVVMVAGEEGAAKPFTLADREVSPAKPPEGERFPTGIELTAKYFGRRTEVARRNLDVLLDAQANREAEIQRTQRLAAAMRARGSDAAPLVEDIAHHRAEIEAMRPQVEAAHKEYEAAMDRLRQHQSSGRGAVSASA